jgi:hypothetical protein
LKKTAFYLGLRKLWVAYKLIALDNSYLNQTGFIKSHQHIQPIDKNKTPIPWMNYAMVAFLDERLNKGLDLFEYGAGFSSIWFAERLNKVVSIEYDLAWRKQVEDLLAPVTNAELVFQEVGEDYINGASKTGRKYHLVLVDGRERVACAKASFSDLTEDGVLILDDSDRAEYQDVFSIAKELGYKNLRISGLKPFSFFREESTIFYRSSNCLGL